MKDFFYWVVLTVIFVLGTIFSLILPFPIFLKICLFILNLVGVVYSSLHLGKSMIFLKSNIKVEILEDSLNENKK